MGFNNQKNMTYSADAESFSARITVGTNAFRADLSYKKGYKVGVPSITTTNMDALMAAMAVQDKTVKFYKTGSDSGAASAKDQAILDGMRTDATVSDAKYRSACRALDQKPQPRNLTATVSSKAQPAVGIIAQLAAWPDFQREHGEIFQPPFDDMNLRIIQQYLLDEGNLPSTPANLEQAYRELKAANCFRTANTLTRGMNGSLQVVQPYSHERILQLRNQQAVDAANAAPSTLSDVDREVWNAVRAKYPQLAVYSDAFKKCCAQTLVLWATDFVKEQQPELAASNKRGELNRAIDTVIMQWSRQSNPRANQNLSSRVWLG